MVFLRETHIIQVARHFVLRLQYSCLFLYGTQALIPTPKDTNIRVVLAAYMIASEPLKVFESIGALEQPLYESATVLTAKLELLAERLQQTGTFYLISADLAESFQPVLTEFLKRFKAWKVPDEAKLLCRVKHALIALYQAEENLHPTEPADSKLYIEFRTQIERLRRKLQQIAGVNALHQFDEDRRTGAPVSAPVATGSSYTELPGRMTNEQLAHELIMNPAFQLSDSGSCDSENPVFHRIRESFHKVCFSLLCEK